MMRDEYGIYNSHHPLASLAREHRGHRGRPEQKRLKQLKLNDFLCVLCELGGECFCL